MPSRPVRPVAWRGGLLLLVLLLAAAPRLAQAHSLGIDRAELIEGPEGTYELAVQVPASLSALIEPPVVPSRCVATGNVRGQRGRNEVRFQWRCSSPLTAGDKLTLPWQREGVMLTVTWAAGERVTRLVLRRAGAITIELGLFRATSGSWRTAAQRYTALGIEHIFLGADHLLFVLGLMWLVRSFADLVKAITAFTLAHSLTLALATFRIVEVPSAPVEAAIALSIVFLAAEIVHGLRGRYSLAHRQPWLVAFGFGLIHGLGFAGALREIGLPRSEIPLGLLFFNLGVEIGQLAFVAIILVLRSLVRSLHPVTAGWTAQLPAYLIGTIAMFWLMERARTMLGPG